MAEGRRSDHAIAGMRGVADLVGDGARGDRPNA
jgi:hypothetical protein